MNLDELITIISASTSINKKDLNLKSCANDFSRWDSLAHIRIILEIQKKTKIKISTSKMTELNSIKSILAYLK
tara:strand:+ start:11 stop:229 length:219 start_codon:yes stop_codon:yes gene_type:complete